MCECVCVCVQQWLARPGQPVYVCLEAGRYMRLRLAWHQPPVPVVGGWPVLSPPPPWSQWTSSSPVTSCPPVSVDGDTHYTAIFPQHCTTFTIIFLHKLVETGRYHIVAVLIITQIKCHSICKSNTYNVISTTMLLLYYLKEQNVSIPFL